MPLEDDIPDLKQEHRDLLILLRAAITGDPPSPRLRRTCWPAALKIARFHQVDMFLYPTVASWPSEFQPSEDLMARWKGAFFGAVMKYERASAQLKEILKTLHEADVPVIPLKGAWLAENIYEHGAMRPMCDFDLLVPLEQFNRARAAFETLGYTTPDHYFDPVRNKDIHYFHTDRPMLIELHFRIWHEQVRNMSEPNLNGMWAGLNNEILHNVPMFGLPIERQLVYLAQHILHHALTISLKAYLDLILILRKFPVDPVKLEAEAKTMAIPFGAQFVLQVAMDIAGDDSSLQLNAFLQDDENRKERKSAMQSTLLMSSASRVVKPGMQEFLDLPLHKRMVAGLRILLTSPDHLRERYPEAVKKYGLIGGYIARLRFLIFYSAPVRNKQKSKNSTVIADFENFNSRELLCGWIHDKDSKERGHEKARSN